MLREEERNIMRKRRVHNFPGLATSGVYGLTQTRDDVKFGDNVIVPDERVVSIIVGAWPLAVTVEHGQLHPKDPACTWEGIHVRYSRSDGA